MKTALFLVEMGCYKWGVWSQKFTARTFSMHSHRFQWSASDHSKKNVVCWVFSRFVKTQKNFQFRAYLSHLRRHDQPVALRVRCKFLFERKGVIFVCSYWGWSRMWFVFNISVFHRYFVFVVCKNFAHWHSLKRKKNRSIEREKRERKMPAWESICQILT